MDLIVAIILISGASLYLTGVPCRMAHARHRRPSWLFAPVGTSLASALTVLLLYAGDALRFIHEKELSLVLVFLVFVLSTGVGLIPALLVVGYYRRKFKHETKQG